MGFADLLKTLGSNSPTFALIILCGWLLLQRIQHQERLSEKARSDIKGMLYQIKDKTEDLHDWHKTKNTDGSFTWMNAGLERVIKELSDNVKEQTKTMQEIVKTLDMIANKVSV